MGKRKRSDESPVATGTVSAPPPKRGRRARAELRVFNEDNHGRFASERGFDFSPGKYVDSDLIDLGASSKEQYKTNWNWLWKLLDILGRYSEQVVLFKRLPPLCANRYLLIH